MFNSIVGVITAKLPQLLHLENNGIEWELLCPDTNLTVLPPVGEKVRVFTWLYHNQDSMRLFGFATERDRSLFLDLTKVNGVGPKAAVKILSSICANELVDILSSDDVGRLEKVPGIGKKTAQKMILALKGTLKIQDSPKNIVSASLSSGWDDVVQALVSMGYDKKDCDLCIDRLVKDCGSDDSFTQKTRKEKEEILFRRAIVELS